MASRSNMLQDLALGFASANNGNVASWKGTGVNAFSRSYGYDDLNRLESLVKRESASGPPPKAGGKT